MKLVCDTHAWMLGYIHVFDHPFFAMTDERGAFSIANIPAGACILKPGMKMRVSGVRKLPCLKLEKLECGLNLRNTNPNAKTRRTYGLGPVAT